MSVALRGFEAVRRPELPGVARASPARSCTPSTFGGGGLVLAISGAGLAVVVAVVGRVLHERHQSADEVARQSRIRAARRERDDQGDDGASSER